jgi:hypothetical protein
MTTDKLLPYRELLERHTATATDPELYGGPVASRYESFRYCFEHFSATGGSTIVELGTIRSFVHGGLPGCNSDDTSYWSPGDPASWDWGAGCFSLLAATCLEEAGPTIHTVDIVAPHIERCKTVTGAYKHLFQYHVCNSVDFLRSLPRGSVDLLYIDTGDMWPIEPTARHQLEEAKAIVRGRLLSPGGLVLIDDVRNATPLQRGDTSPLGKAKYSLPYLLDHGYRTVFDGYQVALAAPRGAPRRLPFRRSYRAADR